MLKAILAAVRTSEFWAFLWQVTVDSLHVPVPDDVKMFTWAYIALRIAGKVARFIFPNGTPSGAWFKLDGPAAILAVVLLCYPSLGTAQEAVPLTAVSQRAHLTANAGAMVLTTGDDWSGASVGGALTYNLHPSFSVFGGYDHGIPVNEIDDSKDFWRVVGSVPVHANAFVGFGYGWFGDNVDGGLVQLSVLKSLAPRLDLGAMYAHVFADNQLDDFEYVKLVLNYHLLGK